MINLLHWQINYFISSVNYLYLSQVGSDEEAHKVAHPARGSGIQG